MQSDSRCLYSYNGNVYEKGSRSRPHHGHDCGSDVTTVMPSGHVRNMARYLDPNLVGSICASAPEVTNTPTPTRVITNTPVPTQKTNTPTPTVVHQSTTTPTPTRQQVQTPTPTKNAVMTPSPTKKTTPIPSPTNTPIAIQTTSPNGSNGGIGKFGMGNQLAKQSDPAIVEVSEPPLTPVENPISPVDSTVGGVGQKIILWSEILVVVSFVLLIVTIVVGVYKRLRTHI